MGRYGRVGLAAAMLLLLPATASAAVQSGSGTDATGEDVPARDFTAMSVQHDTAGATTVSVTLAGAPSQAQPGVVYVFVGGTSSSGCRNPSLVIGFPTDPASAEVVWQRSSDAGQTASGTKTTDGSRIDVTVPASIGVDAVCADGSIRNSAGDVEYDAIGPFALAGPPPPAPVPTPTPSPAPPPAPGPQTGNGNPEGRFGGAFRLRGKVPKLSKRKRSHVYGVCRFSICRVDPVTRRSKVILSGRKGKAYEGISVSRSGDSSVFDFDGDLFRARRDGRNRKMWGTGLWPATRADGRSVTWIQNILVPSCVPDFNGGLSCFHPLVPSLIERGQGEPDDQTVETSVTYHAWWRDRLLAEKEQPRGEADFICVLDAEGECARAVASDPARAMSDPATSADGRFLAVVSEPAKDNREGRGRIELFNPQTGRRVRVVTKGSRDSEPTFSPDGRQIAFMRGDDVLRVSIRGGKPKLVKRDLMLTGASWGLAR